MLRRRRKQAVRYSSVALLRSVLPRRKRWQRHLPVALLLASLVALALAAGRPQVERNVPYARTSVILAVDVSGSMCSTDVQPNRLAVAQEAARAFVESQPKGVRMGLVVFSGLRGADRSADDRPRGARRRDRLAHDGTRHRDRRGHAEGARRHRRDEPGRPRRSATRPRRVPRRAEATPGGNGYVPDIVVLLTDGASNRGIEPLDAVPVRGRAAGPRLHDRLRDDQPRAALLHARPARRGRLRSQQIRRRGRRVRRGGGFGGGGFRRALVADVPTLQAIAERDRRHLPRRRGRRSAAEGVRRPAQGSRDAEAEHRDHLDPGGARRRPRSRRSRSLDALEPVPLEGRAGRPPLSRSSSVSG